MPATRHTSPVADSRKFREPGQVWLLYSTDATYPWYRRSHLAIAPGLVETPALKEDFPFAKRLGCTVAGLAIASTKNQRLAQSLTTLSPSFGGSPFLQKTGPRKTQKPGGLLVLLGHAHSSNRLDFLTSSPCCFRQGASRSPLR